MSNVLEAGLQVDSILICTDLSHFHLTPPLVLMQSKHLKREIYLNAVLSPRVLNSLQWWKIAQASVKIQWWIQHHTTGLVDLTQMSVFRDQSSRYVQVGLHKTLFWPPAVQGCLEKDVHIDPSLFLFVLQAGVWSWWFCFTQLYYSCCWSCC